MEKAEHAQNRSGLGVAFGDLREINSPWRAVLSLARRNAYAKGEQVTLTGKELLFLERGRVRVTYLSLDGAEKILSYIREGCIFGETAFFDPMPAESFFTCAANSVIHSFSEQAIAEIGKERPDLLFNLLRSMARKLRTMTFHASSLSVDSVLVRLCKFLEQRIIPGSSPLTASLGMSRREMAGLLGVNRITLYKVLRQQEEQGLFGPVSTSSISILRPEVFYGLVEK